MNGLKYGLPLKTASGLIVKSEDGVDITSEFTADVIENCYNLGKVFVKYDDKWHISENDAPSRPKQDPIEVIKQEFSDSILEIHKIPVPKDIQINSTDWRVLCRNMKRGKNLLLTGSSGVGKSTIVRRAAETLKLPFFEINLGAVTDVQTALIGKTELIDGNTVFTPSKFAGAITTPNMVVLIDEISRLYDQNSIFGLLQERFILADEKAGTPRIDVAEGVCFVAAANIGSQFSSTYRLDDALDARFPMELCIPWMSKKQEVELMTELYPTAEKLFIEKICEVASDCRKSYDSAKLDKAPTTRSVREAIEMTLDGFTLAEACNIVFVNKLKDMEGKSEAVLQILQLHGIDKIAVESNLFTDDDIKK